MTVKRAPTAGAAATKVLVVDDMEDVRWVLSKLMCQAGYTPLMAVNGEDALTCFEKEAPDVVLLDIGLPDMDGFEVLARLQAHQTSTPVIMVTGSGNTQDAVRAVRGGAWDYLTKPFKNDDVLRTIRYALDETKAKAKLQMGGKFATAPSVDSLVNKMGASPVIQNLQREVERVARTNFSILVTGESGTGKELVSQAIHAHSRRAAMPVVAVDCGAISENLIESELFGHEKGSFTGAFQAKAGAFELALGGTIFLDEIGNLPLAMQGKLLRVLETRKIHRIGSTKELAVDFRVVAATNADLAAMVDQRTFRGDLYHRLAEYSIRIPNLMERKEDLKFLVAKFLSQTNLELAKDVKGLSAAAWSMVLRYDWPGNVRELRNQLRRAVLLCDAADGLIAPDLMRAIDQRTDPLRPDPSAKHRLTPSDEKHNKANCPLCNPVDFFPTNAGLSLKMMVAQASAEVERAMLMHTLALTQGNKAQAARILQLDYKTLYSKLKSHQISAVQFMKDDYKKPDELNGD